MKEKNDKNKSKNKVENNCNKLIEFPEVTKLKEEISKLHIEISMALLERDNLIYIECKNIEMLYMLELGHLEYKAFQMQCQMLRLRRKIELIQAKKNRMEKVIIKDIEKVLDEEFEEYQKKLDEEIKKMNDALKRSNGKALSEEETKEIKMLYRVIVKVLHPDIHKDISEAELKLFYNAVEAYKNGDIKRLRIIKEMVDKKEISEIKDDASKLVREKERLKNILSDCNEEIKNIKENYPYNLKEIVDDPDLTKKKKEEIKNVIDELEETIKIYINKLEEMMEKK